MFFDFQSPRRPHRVLPQFHRSLSHRIVSSFIQLSSLLLTYHQSFSADTFSGTLPPLTPGDDFLDGDGFATNDMDWFNADVDDGELEHGPDEDEDYEDGPDEEASSEDRMSGTDDPHDASESASATVPWADVHGSLPLAYTPTQPLTQPLPARQHGKFYLSISML
jgi:hypothetical protein